MPLFLTTEKQFSESCIGIINSNKAQLGSDVLTAVALIQDYAQDGIVVEMAPIMKYTWSRGESWMSWFSWGD